MTEKNFALHGRNLRTPIRMKTRLLAFIFLLACSVTVFGINASPFPIDLKQPDGTAIRLHVRGDEWMNWFEDQQGFTVVRNGANYVYANLGADGRLVATPVKVGIADPTKTGLAKGLKPTAAAIQAARLKRLSPAQQAAVAQGLPLPAEGPSGSTPASGTVKNLVILCKFSDHDATKIRLQSEFDTIMNTVGGDPTLAPTGSMRDYYTETSYGIVTLQSTVVAWVTLPQTEAYYAYRVA